MQRNVRDYVVVTVGYWAFTLTDGALRMLVLLYLHELGYTAIQIASLFLLYEFFGVVTNLFGGFLGARFGLKLTLFSGLALQIISLALLGVFAAGLTVPLVMFAQALSGIAKDLTKMSSKSYIKLVVRAGDSSALLKWIALLTGSKNTLKGVGFFLGGLLLTLFGFRDAVLGMAAMLAVALALALLLLPEAAGKAGPRVTLGAVFAGDARLKWLSVSRFFLFGSRDVWFVLALPIFLATGLGWDHTRVGGFLALWIIGYGVVQAAAPAYVGGRRNGRDGQSGRNRRSGQGDIGPTAATLGVWTALLLVPLVGITAALWYGVDPAVTLIAGLTLFGVVFATNSAIHSYLVVEYAESDRVSLNVGFYYMANAAGRLVGTVLSGLVFQTAGGGIEGLVACLIVAGFMVVLSAGADYRLAKFEHI